MVLSVLACSTAVVQPRVSISKAQLQQVLDKRFPLRYPIAGLVDLSLQTPAINLIPEQNRLNAVIPLEASGSLLPRPLGGALDVDFALRYEPNDQSIRATQLQFKQVRIQNLPALASNALNAYLPRLAEQSLREVVLYQLRPQDLARANSLGMQPGTITVTDQGLEMAFVAKTP